MSSKCFAKERKIFLSCMNSWFSNFIIEEFRTDFIPDAKVKNTFMGTLDLSGHPLPRLFEPKEITIDTGSSYNQEVFDNDILIYNLDDSNLSEVEFVIRGLKNIKYENEKILILISNIMTWAKTPVKTFTDEERASPDFNEEEVPEIKEEVIVKVENPPEEPVIVEKPKEEEEKKLPAKGKSKGKGKKGKKGKEKEKEDKKKAEKTPKKSSGKKKKGKSGAKDNKESKEKGKKEKDKKAEEEKNNIEVIKKQSEEGGVLPLAEEKKEELASNIPKIKTYYYRENEYRKRIPNNKYLNYKMLENLALSNSNPMLNVYVICPGFIYGCGEDFFFDYFRMSWIGGIPNIPIIGDGMNHIPTIHILDLIQIIRRIIERKPIINYIFACDKTKNPSMKNIIKSITKGIGSIDIQNLNDFDIDEINMPYFNELSIDMRIKSSIVTEDEPQKPTEDTETYNKRLFPWHCEKGIPENMEKISQEFNLYRGIKPIKIVITGPPCAGKSLIAEKIAKQFKITHLAMNDISEWAKNLKSPLGDETRNKIKEMEEIIQKAEEEYEHRKNKKKSDPPFDPSQYKKFSSDFVGKLLKEKLGTGECAGKGYILDNYPKTYQDCVNIFTKITKIKPEGEPEREVIKSLLPDSVIIIENFSEESLKSKLMKNPDYQEKQQEMDLRFNRRMETYIKTNEVTEENPKILKDFYNENNIEIHYVSETDFMMNKELENIKIIEYLERKGPIDNFSRLQDEEEILPFIEPESVENEEEKMLVDDDNDDKKNITGLTNNNNKNDLLNEEKEEITIAKIEEKIKERSVDEDISVKEEKREQDKDENKNETSKKDNNAIKKSKIAIGGHSINEVLMRQEMFEKNIKDRLSELKEREKILLEKKSEVLRRYLSVNVMPLLAKGILTVCQNMPEDPVDALANYLLDNSFKKDFKSEGNSEEMLI